MNVVQLAAEYAEKSSNKIEAFMNGFMVAVGYFTDLPKMDDSHLETYLKAQKFCRDLEVKKREEAP